MNLFLIIKSKIKQYQRWLSPGALLLGFIVDNLTLKRIDLPFETFVLFGYLALAGVGILLLNLVETRNQEAKFWRYAYLWLPLVIQFSFGALFSAFFIFYSRSASLAASWPFLLFLVFMLVGNEFFKKRYLQMTFRISVFFVVLFTFMIFYVPVVLGQIGAWIFLLSGLVSLAAILAFIYFLAVISKARVIQAKQTLIWSVGAIFVVINILYFTNIIPPIPLALKDIGVYYDLDRVAGDYRVLTEDKSWLDWWRLHNVHFVTSDNSSAYAFSSVFAPTDLNTSIVHEWQYLDGRDWTTTSRVTFPISGGRGDGYRGYSVTNNLFPGQWRVNVRTLRGQLIGRESFTVERVSSLPELEVRDL